MPPCPFCQALADYLSPDKAPEAKSSVLEVTSLAAALFDNYPLSPGHTLLIPRRHVADWFELTLAEQTEILSLAKSIRERLLKDYGPDGWNLGVNIGDAGGQTVSHVHLHLIPRYLGDRQDPRGGIRWILPEKAAYWI
jgi:diadenosine tetraphosphate (Ap4A) HIT family hydrolase